MRSTIKGKFGYPKEFASISFGNFMKLILVFLCKSVFLILGSLVFTISVLAILCVLVKGKKLFVDILFSFLLLKELAIILCLISFFSPGKRVKVLLSSVMGFNNVSVKIKSFLGMV